jgi:pimeloyl-ACP methyl ester carboxylesterase
MEIWNGFDLERFEYEGAECLIVYPKAALPGKPYAMKTEYWDAFPAVEIALLQKGFHLVYRKNANRLATPADCHARARLVDHLTEKYGLSPKCVPVGYSCGGAHALNFAKYYPEKVACLYVDAPVVTFCDFPAYLSKPQRRGTPWTEEFPAAYPGVGLSDLYQFPHHPVNALPTLLSNRIPLAMSWGDEDQTVSYSENGALLEDAYRKTDIPSLFILRPLQGHHPHGPADPTALLDFILAQL